MSDFLENIEACINGELDENTCNKIYLQTSMMAEVDAINLYQTIAAKTTNPDIRKIMLDVAKEEKTHVGEFQFLLKEVDGEFRRELERGEYEIKGILG